MFSYGEKLIWKPKGKKDLEVVFITGIPGTNYSGKDESVVYYPGSRRSLVVTTKNLTRPKVYFRVAIIMEAKDRGEAISLVRRGFGFLEKVEKMP